MMTYDPEDWTEMQAEFEKAIPNLTITKDAITQAKLEEAEAKLKNVPTIEDLQKQIRSMQLNFELLIGTGTLDPAVANNNNNATPPTSNNPVWNEIIQERKRELKEAERKRIKELVDQTPEWAEPFLEMVETQQQQPTKEEEAKTKSK